MPCENQAFGGILQVKPGQKDVFYLDFANLKKLSERT